MKKPFSALVLISAVFGVFYLILVTPVGSSQPISPRFDWPDETANYFWAKNFAEHSSLEISEPLNLPAQNQIHPRSFNVRADGALVPGSFLGLILFYGILAKVFSAQVLIYFTPILAILAVLAFYKIIEQIFNEKVAFISALLMLMHPAWWYYSVTSMLPNVVFVSLIIISIFALIRENKIRNISLVFSALLLGLAISIRPSEAIWVAMTYLAIILYIKDKLSIPKILLLGLIALVPVIPSLVFQQQLYGSALDTGYTQLHEVTQEACTSCSVVKSLTQPFGFHPSLVAKNFWLHFISRLWWLSLLALLGLVGFFSSPKMQSNLRFGYVIFSLAIFGWLGIYYGSWEFTDQLTVNLNTLGISYVRYFLPLYLLSLPFIALGLIFLSNFFKVRWRNMAVGFLLAAVFYFNAQLVLVGKPDSILPVKQRIAEYKKTALAVNELTEANSVIVTVRKDKVFFPERKVIHTFEALSINDKLQTGVGNLVELVPVYYYALGPEPKLEFSNGIKLEMVKNFGSEILYQVKL